MHLRLLSRWDLWLELWAWPLWGWDACVMCVTWRMLSNIPYFLHSSMYPPTQRPHSHTYTTLTHTHKVRECIQISMSLFITALWKSTMTLLYDWTVAHLPEKPPSISMEGKHYDSHVTQMTGASAAYYIYPGFLEALTLMIIRFIRSWAQLSCT